ncbi:MAG: peptidoglycan-binding protein [Candidatus Omnitrophica bacterium]|nr:peptidoglycan-binding protein [Candidatus Omnitrophota bacterium]
MRRGLFGILSFSLLGIAALTAAGCATGRPKEVQGPNPADQANAFRNELQAKDQQIQELQVQLEAYKQGTISPGGTSGAGRDSLVRVQGVSLADVQRALARAGFDPGPVDGRAGKKTKAAIKDFQKRHSLAVDGIIGERTWALLK